MLKNTIRSWVEVDTGATIQNLHYAKELTKGKKLCALSRVTHMVMGLYSVEQNWSKTERMLLESPAYNRHS